jgi:hypothetical protein
MSESKTACAPAEPFLPGESLGEVLDAYLAAGAADHRLRVDITRFGNRPPFVDLLEYVTETAWCHYSPRQQDMAFAASYIPAGAPHTVFTIPNALLKALADLYLNTTQGRLTIGSETTKAAGAPPPNGLRTKSKQAAKPASVSTAQTTHTPKFGQHPNSGNTRVAACRFPCQLERQPVMTKNLVPITHVPRRVAALTGLPGPSPRVVYDRVLRGSFPAEQINGRWFVPEDAMAQVAEALGMPLRVTELVAA